MNIENLKTYWYPIMEVKQLKATPIAKKLLGHQLLIVRIQETIICLEDRCPHRNIPLSDGSVINKHIRCNYHGWEFDDSGKLKKLPGCSHCPDNIVVPNYALHVEDKIIWIRLSGTRKFTNPFEISDNFESLISFKTLKSDFIHTIENFLDPTHTPFIHKGLLRNDSKQRMQITQESTDESFTTYYQLLDQQNGWINRLFDKGIDKNIASFILPGFAKIEYLQKEKKIFQVAIFFVPINKGEVQMVVSVSIERTFIPSALKFFLLRPFLELAFRQDKIILEKQYISQQLHKKPYMILESDLVINHLLYLLNNGQKERNKTLFMKL